MNREKLTGLRREHIIKSFLKVKNITERTERVKRTQRKVWKKASRKYKEKQKALVNIIIITPPRSDDDSPAIPSVIRPVRRNIVRKDRTKAYRKIKKNKKKL